MKKCIGIYLRLSLEDVDKRTNRAKDPPVRLPES